MKFITVIFCTTIAIFGYAQSTIRLGEIHPTEISSLETKAPQKTIEKPLIEISAVNKSDRFILKREGLVFFDKNNISEITGGWFLKGSFDRPKVKDMMFSKARNQINISIGKQFSLTESILFGIDLGTAVGFNYAFAKTGLPEVTQQKINPCFSFSVCYQNTTF